MQTHINEQWVNGKVKSILHSNIEIMLDAVLIYGRCKPTGVEINST